MEDISFIINAVIIITSKTLKKVEDCSANTKNLKNHRIQQKPHLHKKIYETKHANS